jgi:hypothetical protein
MTRKVQDGQPLVTGVIRAEDQAADIRGERVLDGKVPLTPSQKRALDENRWPDDAEAAPGYEAGNVVVTDPNKPSRPPRDETQPLEDAWNRIDADAAAAESSGNGDVAARAAVLRAAAVQGKAMMERARANGTSSPETIKAGMKLAEKIAAGVKRLNID